MNNRSMRLGDILVNSGLITQEQLKEGLGLQKATGKKLGELLIDEGYVKEEQIIEVLEFQLGIPHLDLKKYYIDPEAPGLIGERLARRHNLIPVNKEENKITVAMSDPLNIFAIDDVKITTGMDVLPVIATNQNILDAIEQHYGGESAKEAIEQFKKEYGINTIEELNGENVSEVNNAPMVRLVNSIMTQAVKLRVSDIHIEPSEKKLRIRFRVDGELQEMMTLEKSIHSAIVSRIKIMGSMNIAEKRVPQDGRVEMTVENRDIDMRLSVLPTVFGEKIVIRLLDRSSFFLSKSELGFSKNNLTLFDKVIKKPYGILLVTGPTGSGKTTTLYSTLKELNKINRNIVTVEDPVEYKLEGINQVQVNDKTGLTFANGLRAILRQDPDIVMIGEIRDAETAQIAIRAAITGHLVLSTLHTNDTASAITRLMDMGIEPYLVSASVIGVIAQRLVKKICENCRQIYTSDTTEEQLLSLEKNTTLYRGKGCNLCNHTGYKFRQGIHEVMLIDEEIRTLIDDKSSIDKVRRASVNRDTVSLKESCKELVLQGITTTDEFIRTVYSLD